jgi:hypothetical protein
MADDKVVFTGELCLHLAIYEWKKRSVMVIGRLNQAIKCF